MESSRIRRRPLKDARVICALEPLDAALVPIWYGLPESFRAGVRLMILQSAALFPISAIDSRVRQRARSLLKEVSPSRLQADQDAPLRRAPGVRSRSVRRAARRP